MKIKITKGYIKGVNNPDYAENLIIKGSVTY